MNKLIWLVILASIGVAIHAGFMFAKPVINHKFFVADAEELMRFNFDDYEDVERRFLALANERSIPLNPGDSESIEIWDEGEGRYTVKIGYSVTVNYYDIYQKTFKHELEFKK